MQKESLRADREKWHIIFRGTIGTLTSRKKQWKLEDNVTRFLQWLHQGCMLSPCLFNLYEEYIMRNTGLEETQAGIKIAGRNINNLRYADDTALMAESEEELKSLLRWKWKRRLKKLA